ncbi:tRNA uridine-5-carboxymethylaminomethyl(34) synthesis GTPase MnmE [uncultured Chryseobacterium sp.]|uniref:tRNA uridine-5-carboxymethylaminomethyl(34) synthesis GTPase MnmE n=1 Tax=uncultured Chryseobacterium sp. TaxID=259322 RepID=UPI002612D832|nr:tRNA uridine-5-carboxymethylaminomethyl(34) synthesis GTPase MnmE [uncultured Chryseobacterium sp.]
MNKDTICALATANGIGALGIIRLSGEEAVSIAQKSFKGKNLERQKSHTVHYGYMVDGEEIIDEIMVSVFLAPKTFTTENVVEISFHGSPHIAKKILEALIKNGARMAKAGEFTMRAFMNGRIDLAQAESIADLIASENEASRKVALNQLKGGISNEISLLRGDLLNFTSLIELELDFSEEDVEFADRTALNQLVDRIENKLSSLIESFQYGNAIKNGVDVAIIGKPNAGKSTLLNALLKEERAIVSDIAGTTRDTIEEVLHIKGAAFRFIDTAGIRETTDEIEAIGVQKAKEKIATARILLYLYDEFDSKPEEVIDFVKTFWREDLKMILLHNKIDLHQNENNFDEIVRDELKQNYTTTILQLSAKDQTGIEALKAELISFVENLKTEESNTVITNQRHFEALQKSLDSVNRVKEAVSGNISTELLAYELRSALEHLGEISGEFTNDEVLGNIFSKFCIGK